MNSVSVAKCWAISSSILGDRAHEPFLMVNSVQDLIALAKAKSGTLTYASAGIGTPHQIFAELFKTKTGVDIRHVPYRAQCRG
jgi:tripartite-type tricarboxylate transporter receptor subunit TctC